MAKVYVSSTYNDLVEHRQQVHDVLRKMRYDVIAMEDYVATDKRPLDKCLADVASCDVYVGIFAWRYGYIPEHENPKQRSITELEYWQAEESGLERLIFLLGEDAPWPRQYMDEVTGKGERGQKIKALRQEFMEEHTLQFFKSPEELAGQVAASVAQWAQGQLEASMDSLRAKRDQDDKKRREMRDRQRVVNLRPLDVAHFKDRLREMQALSEHLTEGSVRLVSVVGRGGMGKTALVSKVLADLERGRLPVPDREEAREIDGILYLSARSTGLGLERIYADVERMLGEPAASVLAARWANKEMPLAAKVETLLETMQNGLYLILLDNLEDYLGEDGIIEEEGMRLFVERCLTQPGGARLVVTSREEVKIEAAALRAARRILLRKGLPEDEAVALLRDLDPQGTLGLRDAPEDDLRRAAGLTQGIPRALEILAGILHEDPTVSLPRLLADEELFGKQVVEQLVAEGYRRLRDDEQRVMEALAVFDRPVDETAIAYLLYPWFPGLNVRACLRRLGSGYFVSANRITGEYSLHPLDRAYAYQQIPTDRKETSIMGSKEGKEPVSNEAERPDYNQPNLEGRAADFYASIGKPKEEWKTIDDLAPHLAEFEHRVRADDYYGAFEVLEHINDHLILWGHCTQLIEMREKLRKHLTNHDSQAATNLGNLGLAYLTLEQFEQAINCLEEAVKIAAEIKDSQREGLWRGHLGHAYLGLGQVEQAVKLLEKALTIAREVGDRRNEGLWHGYLGLAFWVPVFYTSDPDLQQIEETIKYLEEALAIAEDIGDFQNKGAWTSRLATVHHFLGNQTDDQKRVEKANEYYKEALAITRKVGDRVEEGRHLAGLARGCHDLGQFEQAIEYYQEALAITREMGSRWGEGVCLGNMGSSYKNLKQFEEAIKYLEEALAITREIGDRRGEHIQLVRLIETQHSLGEVEQALAYYNEAKAISDEAKAILPETWWDHQRAIRLYEAALPVVGEIGDRQEESYQWLELGNAHRGLGKFDEATTAFQKSLNIAEESGDQRQTAMVHNAMGDLRRDLEKLQEQGREDLDPLLEQLPVPIDDLNLKKTD